MPSSTLEQWEKRLQPVFTRRLKMIGEVGLSRLEMEDIANAVRISIKQNGIARTTQLLFNKYPFTFLCLLTFFSTYNTEFDYWGALADEIGTERNYLFNRRWHHTYVEKAKKLGLRTFDFEDVHKPFVTTIRFHGGIPIYSLPDYFRFIVFPSVDRPEMNEVPSDQALQNLLENVFHVDAPVRTFLENSGKLGLEFFESSRRLARHYRQNGEALCAEEVDLPEHVVEAFETFIQEVLNPTEKGIRTKLRKPVLLFSPYYDRGHLFLRLPGQELPLRYADGDLEWQIGWTGSSILIHQPCKVKMHRQNMVIEVIYLPIEACPKVVQISLVYQSADSAAESLREWSIRLKVTDEADQIITFRSDGVLLHPGDPLPAEELLLVYPADIDLQMEGASHPSRVYGSLFGAWKGWQANGWDLSHSWSLQMLRNGHPIGVPLPISSKLPMPELLGDPDTHDVDPGGSKLYIDQIPKLRIPIRSDLPLRRELDRWKVNITSIGRADPDCEKKIQLGDYQSNFKITDNWAEISLSHFLGPSPIGTYTICLGGPIDDEIEYRIRLWSKATVLGMKPALFPGPAGPETQTLTLRLPDNARCEVQAGVDGVLVNQKTFGWEVVVSPETTQAGVNLIWKQPGREDIWVPFYLSLPRLRWSLVLDQDQGDLEWAYHSFHKSIDQILQSSECAIHVDMPGLDSANQLSLDLVEVDETERVRQSEAFHRTPFSKDWKRISLGRFADSLRHNSGLLHFDLSFQATRGDPVIHIPLVFVTRKLDLSEVNLIPIGELSWRIAWSSAYQVKNCWVLLQPAWQPWVSAQRFRIPDITSGSLDIHKIGLPSSRYQLHFYVSAVDEALPKKIPRNGERFDVDLCNPDQRLSELEIQLQSALAGTANETIFKSIFEMACIYEDIGDSSMRDKELSKLATPFVHITNLHLLLAFFGWLDDQSVQGPFVTFFYRIMFKPELVGQFLPHYHKNDPELKAYLTYVPRVKDIYSQSAVMIARYSDDPVILNTCFHRLIQQEEIQLIALLVEMIQNARLTIQDVADLLAQKSEWAFSSLLEYETSSMIDSILGALVEKCCSIIDGLSEEKRRPLILRILPYINDQNLWFVLLQDLILCEELDGYRLLMEAQRSNKLDQNSISKLLSLAPSKSIQVLRDAPAASEHQVWLDFMYNQFPTKAGFIKAGCKLKTPFGTAVVDHIETSSGDAIDLVEPHRQDLRILVYIGEDQCRELDVIDNSNLVIYFPNVLSAYQCNHCNFTSPNQHAIQQHHRETHHFMSLGFKKVSPRIDISLDDIQIIE